MCVPVKISIHKTVKRLLVWCQEINNKFWTLGLFILFLLNKHPNLNSVIILSQEWKKKNFTAQTDVKQTISTTDQLPFIPHSPQPLQKTIAPKTTWPKGCSKGTAHNNTKAGYVFVVLNYVLYLLCQLYQKETRYTLDVIISLNSKQNMVSNVIQGWKWTGVNTILCYNMP